MSTFSKGDKVTLKSQRSTVYSAIPELTRDKVDTRKMMQDAVVTILSAETATIFQASKFGHTLTANKTYYKISLDVSKYKHSVLNKLAGSSSSSGSSSSGSESHVETPQIVNRIATDELNLRKGAGLSYSIVKTVPAGTTLSTVSGTEKSADGYVWVQVSYNGNMVWAASKYMASETPAGSSGDILIRTTTATLSLRTGPGLSNKEMYEVPAGTDLATISGTDQIADGYTWVQLKYQGTTLWATSKYMSEPKESKSSKAKAASAPASAVMYTRAAAPESYREASYDDLHIGDVVYFTGGKHYHDSLGNDSRGGTRTAGKAKITSKSKGKPHPIHLVGTSGGSNVYGWVDLATVRIIDKNPTPTPPTPPPVDPGVKKNTSKIWYVPADQVSEYTENTSDGNEYIIPDQSVPIGNMTMFDTTGTTFDPSSVGKSNKDLPYSKYVNDPYSNEVYTLSDKGRELFAENNRNNDDNLWKSILNMGIVDREDQDNLHPGYEEPIIHNRYDRVGCIDPYNGFVGSKEYVFFTRPDLHMFNEITDVTRLNDELTHLPLFNDFFVRYPYIFKVLQSSISQQYLPTHPFITLLTNTIASPIQLPEITAKTHETGANAFGTKILYRGTSHPSDEDITFTTEFTDNRYLEVFHFFKVFDEYIRQKQLGWITPRDPRYTINKILADQISIFKLVVAEDGESLLYWAKWTGCSPMNVPSDALSDLANTNGNLTFSITWHAQFFDDDDMDILQDFNTVVRNYTAGYTGNGDIPLYDPATGMGNGEWAKYPYIAIRQGKPGVELDRLSRMRQLKLKWR